MALLVGSSPTGASLTLDVIDTQVHANTYGHTQRVVEPAETLELVRAAMDALGIDGIVIHEYSGRDDKGRMLPGAIDAADGVWRSTHAFSSMAVAADPKRFRYVGSIDWRDPTMPAQMRHAAEDPHGPIALRLVGRTRSSVAHDPEFVNGDMSPYFEQAEINQIPIFLVIAPKAGLVGRYAKQFPNCQFILDHMGVVSGDDRPGLVDTLDERKRRFDELFQLARYPNVAIKWCHLERIAVSAYPFPEFMASLRSVIDAFGAQRIMWAGDPTQSNNPSMTAYPLSWAQTLHSIVDGPLLTGEEKAWILGRTARTLLRWT
ncbi:amidohydrolase family protein [Devosia sp. A369]